LRKAGSRRAAEDSFEFVLEGVDSFFDISSLAKLGGRDVCY